MRKNIFMGGAHRGGRAITEHALQRLAVNELGEIVVADPKEDRAARLAQVWKDAGFQADGVQEPCEVAIDDANVDAAMLSIDTIKPMREILGKHAVSTQWQLLARGLGSDGPLIGLAGTVTAGRTPSREASVRLLEPLSTFIAPESSARIKENLLNADILQSMRKRVSDHSVSRLKVLDWDPKDVKDASLGLFWGANRYPLVVHERSTSQLFRQTKQQAQETELTHELKDVNAFAVGVIAPKAVDFFVVDSTRRRRTVKFHMPLVHSLPPSAVAAAAAVVTD
jgi:hypothetical protein